jgi:hypothetical protein
MNVISNNVFPDNWFAARQGSTAADNDIKEKPSININPIFFICDSGIARFN